MSRSTRSRTTKTTAAASAAQLVDDGAPAEVDSDEKYGEHAVVEVDSESASSSSDSGSAAAGRSLSIRELTAIVQALPKWSPNTIFEVFMRRVEVQLKSFRVPEDDWFRVLMLLFGTDINAQEWIRAHVVDHELTWGAAKELLSSHFESADYQENLEGQYQTCRQFANETVQAYGDRFLYL